MLNRVKIDKHAVAAVTLALLVWALLACAGCAIRYRGQEAFAVDPLFEIFAHHPEAGSTNAWPR